MNENNFAKTVDDKVKYVWDVRKVDYQKYFNEYGFIVFAVQDPAILFLSALSEAFNKKQEVIRIIDETNKPIDYFVQNIRLVQSVLTGTSLLEIIVLEEELVPKTEVDYYV